MRIVRRRTKDGTSLVVDGITVVVRLGTLLGTVPRKMISRVVR